MCEKRVIPVCGLLLCLAACMITASSSLAANIIWVDEAAALGFEGWPELLEGAGHTVTRKSYLTTLDDAMIQTLNAADLVIFSRDANSGSYVATGEPEQWNGLTVPLILANAYLARSSRWQWLNSTAIVEVGDGANLIIAADHPIFNGVGAVGDQVAMVTNATALTGATDGGNGEVLATDASGRVWIALWEDTKAAFYDGSAMKPAATRMWFGAGYGSSVYGETLGSMNLTEQGQAIFLNAVAYLTGALHRVKAYDLQPGNGVILDDTSATLSWKSGYYTTSHLVYIGTDFNDVRDRNIDPWVATDLTLSVGTPGGLYPEGLVHGQTYYWCVDEVNEAHPESPWKGAIRSFSLLPEGAWDPSPVDGAQYIPDDSILTWQSGMGTLLHRVHFSRNFDEVNEPAVTPPLVKDASYDPGVLDAATTYYWRVDEFKQTETVRGDIWSFTTIPEIPVANDPNLTLQMTLHEGTGTVAVDWSGHRHHGTVKGNARWVDGGLSFDGQDDFISALLNVSETEYAAALWIKTTDPDCGIFGVVCQDLAADGSASADRSIYLIHRELGAKIYTSGGALQITTAGLNLADGCWHHVVHTFGASLGGEKLYVDEVEQASSAVDASAFDWDDRVNVGWSKHGSNQYFTGRIEDVCVYNRTLSAEDVERVMRGDILLSWNPLPLRGANLDIRTVDGLEWAAGDTAAKHDVYFGQDRDAVKAADADSAQYQGRQSGTSFSLEGLVEFGGGPYYWRVDEVEADGTTNHEGAIWDFTVLDYMIVDDFESYTDYEGSLIYEFWIDGLASSNSGSVVGNMEAPYAEHDIINSGTQAMPFDYNNTNSPYYSEAETTFSSVQDWTDHGVTNLVLFVCGSLPDDDLYVEVEDSTGKSAMAIYPDHSSLVSTAYTEWTIPLSDFAGVSKTKVKKLYIGVGSRTSPKVGGSGRIYIDDIRLTKS